MKAVIVDLTIAADKFELWYQGSAANVIAQTIDGRRVRFPASILRPYVSRTGIKGRFRILFDDENRFCRIDRIDL
ncbi:DUF2835 domain-containing protein [Gilvimarinus sp. SDUM040013]|uniref:DUF2835 domain-containing protein n=1 Tax=Gilvimarinus gilvus TaxID=3058038 RepID=A0ABU4RZ10_9GAMM|nr:DUF2835 domain-containing protein [Gilvimarinus sp. SDUM040013]MDO3385761.1 DUF2835 domain-containing protein [Gilvimarinus sp. SDUM040013]MDX6849401.1 DUF2835 domain-containing protein [Gilvimarinus sp. SDUM040013]